MIEGSTPTFRQGQRTMCTGKISRLAWIIQFYVYSTSSIVLSLQTERWLSRRRKLLTRKKNTGPNVAKKVLNSCSESSNMRDEFPCCWHEQQKLDRYHQYSYVNYKIGMTTLELHYTTDSCQCLEGRNWKAIPPASVNHHFYATSFLTTRCTFWWFTSLSTNNPK